MKSKLLIVSAALAMSFAVPASAYDPLCNSPYCGDDITGPYPTKPVPVRRTIAEHANYIVTKVSVGINETKIEGGYLHFTGVSFGSPYGGFYVINPSNGRVINGLNNTGAPTYLTSTRTSGVSPVVTTLWNGISQFYVTLYNWTTAGSLYRWILSLF